MAWNDIQEICAKTFHSQKLYSLLSKSDERDGKSTTLTCFGAHISAPKPARGGAHYLAKAVLYPE
jgi:hypothetical protein